MRARIEAARRRVSAGCAGIAILAIASAPAAGQEVEYEWTFQGLGQLADGDWRSESTAVSPDGSVAIGNATSPSSGANATQAFLWNEDGDLVGLGALSGGAFNSTANDVSSTGAHVVGASSSAASGSQQTEAYVWDDVSESMTGLGFLNTARKNSGATGISSNGDVIVGWSANNVGSNTQAFIWNEDDDMVGLGYMPNGAAWNSFANGVSNDGTVVAGAAASASSGASSTEAFRWTPEGGMEELGFLDPNRTPSRANAVSGDGTVIVGGSTSDASGNGQVEAFIWNENDGMEPLGFLSGGQNSSEAFATTLHGDVVVGTADSAVGTTAFIWDAQSQIRSVESMLEADGLDLTGWFLWSANGISDDGRVISGVGLNPSGYEEAWVAELVAVPEPAALAAQIAALASLRVITTRRRNARRA